MIVLVVCRFSRMEPAAIVDVPPETLFCSILAVRSTPDSEDVLIVKEILPAGDVEPELFTLDVPSLIVTRIVVFVARTSTRIRS